MNFIRAILIAFALLPAPLLAADGHDAPLRPEGVAEKLGYCPGDTAVVIPAWVRSLPDFCFAGCDSLRSVSFAPDSRCALIGAGVFAECPDLRSAALPPSLRVIGEGAFRECRSLRALSIPSGVWIIPKEMCLRCVSLDSISLPATIREIHSSAFNGCVDLRDFPFPASLQSIGANAFSGCASLTDADLPPGLRSLESYAFSGCGNLRRASLPVSHEALGELIFSGCRNLRELVARSPSPPSFECESAPFDPQESYLYRQCLLRVPSSPASALPAYRRISPWSLFKKIKD